MDVKKCVHIHFRESITITLFSCRLTDNYGICCLFVNNDKTNCTALPSPFNTCKSMFPNHVLRATLWLVCLSAVVANLVVVVSRIKSEIPAMRDMFSTEVNTNQNAFLVSLAIADFLMGLYLLCIGIADARFGRLYFLSAYGWRNGVGCKVVGFIGFVSNVASILSLTFVSVERFFTVSFSFGRFRFGSKLTKVICVLIWIISIVIALLPIILSVFAQGLFGLSDVCLGLPFVIVPEKTGSDLSVTYDNYGKVATVSQNDPRGLEWVYSQIIYIYFSSVCVFINTVCYIAMFVSIIQSRIGSGRQGNKGEIKTAIKMSIIVGTDVICWLPVIITGFLSKTGTEISIDMYAWLAICVMPINSAFNPFIYTIPTIKRRKQNEPSFIADQRHLPDKKAGRPQRNWIPMNFIRHVYRSNRSQQQDSP
ncbi:hypothetical protein HOLleu_20954 [Holothuria leucospilota]|uniref:G-protein coupled receptors family 1 profile domain-containing protein n=1 Tax=Holothuria leucospilota TaxID=206669 RepID=A0A9Q1H650_HOLLE|nr:hypothetical protein HOLleu_20954 [Holothuria leucospilota]